MKGFGKGLESGFGSGESKHSGTAEAEPQSSLLTEPNFKDMCGKAGTTMADTLALLAEAGSQGVAVQKYLEQLIAEYNEKLQEQELVSKEDLLAGGKVAVQKVRIASDIVELIVSIASHAE